MIAPDPRAETQESQEETERDLEELQRPMDDPQTRPALDPDEDPPEVT